MRKIVLFVFLLPLVIFSAAAEPANRDMANVFLSASFGLMSGEIEEIVYRYSGSDEKLSELIWELKPLYFMGIDFYFGLREPENTRSIPARIIRNTFFDVSFKYGFPGKTGSMEDRDWMDSSNVDRLTHYSVHDNYTKSATLIDLGFGKSFRLHNNYWIKAFFVYSYMDFRWTAYGGTYLYYNSYGYLNSSEEVITYTQSWHIVSPGVSFYGAFNDIFNIELFFKISPLVWASAVDNHLKTGVVYNDYPQWGIFVEPGLLFSANVAPRLTLAFSWTYRLISGPRGNSIADDGSSRTLQYYDVAGAGYSVHSFGIIVKHRVF